MSVFQDLEAKITSAHNQIITVTRKLDELSDVEISLGYASKGLSASAESSLQLTSAQRELISELRAATQAVAEAGSALRKADPERLGERLSSLTAEVQTLRSDLAKEALARERQGALVQESLQQQASQLASIVRDGTLQLAEAVEHSTITSTSSLEAAIKLQAEQTVGEVAQLQHSQEELLSRQAAAFASLTRRVGLLVGISLLGLAATLGIGVYTTFLSP